MRPELPCKSNNQGPRFSRFVPILKRLHWLPINMIKFRILLKIYTISLRTLTAVFTKQV